MKIGKLIEFLEDWAPPGTAWEKDSIGLQIGNAESKISGILICLELDQGVLTEALNKKCNVILTHHPLLFRPLKKLDFGTDRQSKLIQQLIKRNISVFSAHTNLDFTREGVSYQLATTLGLEKIGFLKKLNGKQYKLAVFVPADHADTVAESVFNAGGGVIGEYSRCSFRSAGEGTFKGSENSNPAVGKKNNFEITREIRLEFLVDSWLLNKAVGAVRASHPYEEPAYDIYPLENQNINFGEGALGELPEPLSCENFLSLISRNLKLSGFRYCSGKKNLIKRVAVCGGAGSDLVETAVASKADAFVTADIKYHTFHDAAGRIMLVDGGHYETEAPVLNVLHQRVKNFVSGEKNIKVYNYSGNTNPVLIFKQ